jgi:hypothetical protein
LKQLEEPDFLFWRVRRLYLPFGVGRNVSKKVPLVSVVEPWVVANVPPLPLLDSFEGEPQMPADWETRELQSPVVVVDPLVFDLPTIGEVI